MPRGPAASSAAGPRSLVLLSTFYFLALVARRVAHAGDAGRRLGRGGRVVALGLDHEHDAAVLLRTGFIARGVRHHQTGLAVADRLELRRRHALGDEIVAHRVR